MDKLISIDDERLWGILFEEACVEGEQAERIYSALKGIAKPAAFDKAKVTEGIAEIMNDESIRFVEQAVNRSIEIAEKGGA